MPAGVTEAMHTPESPSHGKPWPPANPYAGGMHHTPASTSPRDQDSWAAALTTARGVKRSSSHGEPAARHQHPDHEEPLEDAPSVRMRSISQDGGPPQAPSNAPLRSAASAADMHAAAAHLADELPAFPPDPYAGGGMHVGGDEGGYMPQPRPAEPLRWSGQVTCGVAQLTDARAAVRTCVRAVVAAYSAIVPPAAMRRLCISNAEHIEELLHAFPTEAADMHGAEEEMHDVEGFAYHTAVTAALQFVLGELRGGMRHMAGLINVMVRHPHACVPPPTSWCSVVFAPCKKVSVHP